MQRLKIFIVMILWGSIGVFTRYINISPVLLSFLRSLIALPVIFAYGYFSKSLSFKNMTFKKSLPFMICGVLLAAGFITLFMGFAQSDISAAVIAYNMCPVYVLLLAPIVLKEKLKSIHVITVLIAFVGLFFIVYSSMDVNNAKLSGVIYAAISGVIYAIIVIINRKVNTSLSTTEVTFIQMFFCMIVLLPIVLAGSMHLELNSVDIRGILMILILGVVHTGIAYVMYFSTYRHLPAVTIGILSYIDPTSSMIFAVLLLGEVLTPYRIFGALLILGSTMFCEIYDYRRNKIQLA